MKLPKQRLFQNIKKRFNKNEIRVLCMDLGINHEELDDKTLTTLTESLLIHVEKHGQIRQLVALLEQKHPLIPWSTLAFAEMSCPYRGLLPFREEDTHLFFGRDTYIERLLEVIEKQPLVAVIGPSGSGKSSVVFAGLIPRLRQTGQWQIIDFRPSQTPFENLATELIPFLEPTLSEREQLSEANELSEDLIRGKTSFLQVVKRITKIGEGQKLLLFIDQFEELYTQNKDSNLQESFMKALLSLQGLKSTTVLLTMRADFLGRALSFRPFADAIHEGSQMIGPMDRDELLDVIERPLSGTFISLEPRLATQMLDDVGKEAGNLPLLEFALESLWAEQKEGQLTFAAYEKIGKVEGALTKRADDAYKTFVKNEEGELVRRLFVQLVQPVTGSVNTKRKAWRRELGDELWQVTTELVDKRLLVTNRDEKSGEQFVELAHEALITNWWRFEGWIQEDWEFRAWQERLRVSFHQWESHKKDKGFLLLDAPLAIAEEWLKQRQPELSDQEITFINASVAAEVQRRAEEEARQKQKLAEAQAVAAERKRRLMIATGSLVLAIILGITAVFFWINSSKNATQAEANLVVAATAESNAEARASEAERALALANARQLISQGQATFEANPLIGLALVLEGLTLTQNVNEEIVFENIRQEIFQPGRYAKLGEHVERLRKYNDYPLLLIINTDMPSELRNVQDGSLFLTLPGKVERLRLDSSNRLSLIDYRDSPDELRNAENGTLIKTLSGEINDWGFNPSKTRLLLEYSDTVGELRNAIDGSIIQTLSGKIDKWRFDPNGRWLLLDYVDAPGELRNVDDGSIIETLSGEIVILRFDPNSSLFLVDYLDSASELRNAEDGSVIETLSGNYLLGTFNPKGNSLFVTYKDSMGELRNKVDGTLIKAFPNKIKRGGFDPEGNLLLLDYSDAVDELRNAEDGTPFETLSGIVFSWAFIPDGNWILLYYSDSFSELRNVEDGTLVETLSGYLHTESLAPNGQWLLLDYLNGVGELRNVHDGTLLYNVSGEIGQNGFDPDGRLLLLDYSDADDELRNVEDGTIIETFSDEVLDWEFDPNGRFLLLDYSYTNDELRNIEDSSTIKIFPDKITQWIFDSEGQWLNIWYDSGNTELWNLSGIHQAASLGANVDQTTFLTTANTVAIKYQDGNSYLLDLEWLEAMKGEVYTMPIDQLIALACEYPLDGGAVLQQPEMRIALQPFLEQVGLEEPQACQ